MKDRYSESVVEDAVVAWLEGAGYDVVQGSPIAVFGKAVQSLIKRSSAAICESQTLNGLRAALLPELISGAIRVGAPTENETDSPP